MNIVFDKLINKKNTQLLLFRFSGVIINFLLTIFISRFYGVSNAGIFILSTTILYGIAIILRFGQNTSFVQILGMARNKREVDLALTYVNSGMIFSLLITFIFLLISFVFNSIFSELVIEVDKKVNFEIIFYCLPLIVVMQILSGVFQGLSKHNYAFLIEFTLVPVSFFIILFFKKIIAHNIDFSTVISSYCLAIYFTFVISITVYFKTLKPLMVFRMKRMQRRIVFGSKFLFIDLIYYGITSMPILVLSYYETTKNIGIFNVSMRTAAMLAVLLSISNTIISPKFSALARGGDFREIVRIYIFTSLIFFLFSLISLLFFQLFSTQYLSLFGPDLNGAEDILFLLIVSQLINMILGPAGPALAMCGFEKELIKCCFVSFTAVIISSAVLIPNYGMLGAGWVILIGMLVLKVTMLIYLSKRMDVLFHFRSLFFKTS